MKKIVIILLTFLMILPISTYSNGEYLNNQELKSTDNSLPFFYDIGKFEESFSSLEDLNNSLQWNIFLQKRYFIQTFDKQTFTTVSGLTAWRSRSIAEIEESNISMTVNTINDPIRANNKILHVKFLNHGYDTIHNDFLLYLDTNRYAVLRAVPDFRILISTSIPQEQITSIPEAFNAYFDLMMLSPEDDNKLYTFYSSNPDLDYRRTLNNPPLNDSNFELTLGLMNLAYFKAGGTGEGCPPLDQFKFNDVIGLKCEIIVKFMSNTFSHGSWLNEPLIFKTKPTDRFQLFAQNGTIKVSLGFEFHSHIGNNTINFDDDNKKSGIFDIFFDNFYMNDKLIPKTKLTLITTSFPSILYSLFPVWLIFFLRNKKNKKN